MSKQKHVVEIVVKPDIDIDEQLRLHEKGWIIQRIGWFLIIGIMIAGAAGVFGGGGISKKKYLNGSISIEYEQFFRSETEMKILIESESHISSISIPQQYLKEFRIVHFVPEPFNNYTTDQDVVYNFLQGRNHMVAIYLIPKNYGSIGGVIKVNGLSNITLNHFIYP